MIEFAVTDNSGTLIILAIIVMLIIIAYSSR